MVCHLLILTGAEAFYLHKDAFCLAFQGRNNSS
jgi:hypothetical protein